MEQFKATRFYLLGSMLSRWAVKIEAGENLDELASPKPRLYETLNTIKGDAKAISLSVTARRCDFITEQLRTGKVSRRMLATLFEELHREIEWEMDSALFMHIPADRADRYNQAQLFGPKVDAAFPNAQFDIKEAGNCYAAGRYTACVFHLMRVLEFGLAAFGREVSADERNNWQQWIDGIEKKLREMGKAHKDAAEKLKYEQYNQAASSFMIFRDAWRNYTAHARGKYTEEEADAILRNVEAFMRQLAKIGLKEES